MGKNLFPPALLHRFKGFFTRNIGLKIVAFIFAILLWAYVLVALNPVRSKSIDDVPITLEGYTDLLSRNLILVNSDLGLADVEVNATITNHADLDNSRVICRASLGTISAAGTYRLPLSVTVQSNLGTVASVNPRTVTVEVENLVVKTVPVKLELTGTLPEGYEVIGESYASTITIEGAARYIEPTVRAVATVDLTGRTENVEESVNLVFYDRNDQEVTVVTRTQNAPNVTVRLSLSAYKRVSVQQAVSLADDTYFTLTSEVSPASVVIYGTSEVLETIEAVSTQSLVLPAEVGVVSRELALDLPDGISLKRGQSSSVVLSAVVTEKTGERTMEVPLVYGGQSGDLVLADGAPTFVTVSLSGPLRQLELLTAGQLTAYVDLTGYGEGSWELIPVIRGLDDSRFSGVIAALQEQRIQVTLAAPAAAPNPAELGEPEPGEQPETGEEPEQTP